MASGQDTSQIKEKNVTFIPGEANQTSVRCTRCRCLLLRPDHGLFVSCEITLPPTTTPRKEEGEEKESNDAESSSQEWIEVSDIFTFENMGFSHTVDGMKYLVCADCEWGPIGCQDLSSSKSYLCLSRILLD